MNNTAVTKAQPHYILILSPCIIKRKDLKITKSVPNKAIVKAIVHSSVTISYTCPLNMHVYTKKGVFIYQIIIVSCCPDFQDV